MARRLTSYSGRLADPAARFHSGLGGGGHHHGGHHHHGGGGGRWGYPYPGYYPYAPTVIYGGDCVRDPLDLRRCLPPEAGYAGIGADPSASSLGTMVVVGGVLLGILMLSGRKARR